jgi:hypothetical protein
MAVTYRQQARPGAPVVRRFQDTFNRASGKLGPNWIHGITSYTPFGNPVNAGQAAIGASTQDGLQALLWFANGTINPGQFWNTFLLCAPLISACLNKSQYSQWSLVKSTATAGNGIQFGPATMVQSSGSTASLFGYCLLVDQTPAGQMYRVNGNAFTALGAGFAVAAGDILRLEATINPGDVTLVAKKNAVTQVTVVDNAASRLSEGSPGMIHRFSDNSGGQTFRSEWRNFDGGLL